MLDNVQKQTAITDLMQEWEKQAFKLKVMIKVHQDIATAQDQIDSIIAEFTKCETVIMKLQAMLTA